MFSDKPIASTEQDELGYSAFAERLVRPLVDWPTKDSLVVGLYGAWGVGKSSVLNLLAQKLASPRAADAKRVTPIRFNPWLYGDTESLLLAFFGTLSAETRQHPSLRKEDRESLSEALSEMGEALGPMLSLADDWGGAIRLTSKMVARLFRRGQKDVFERKLKAGQILETIGSAPPGHRIVVLLDDLDRLEPGEVRATLKLVKLLADLPYVSYVLAMDQERVANLLNDDTGETGMSYLEKIIQLPVYLPDPSRSKIQELLEAQLRQVLGSDPFNPRHRSTASLTSYERTLGRHIRTLRDRARLGNNLRFLVQGGDRSLDLNPLDAVLVSFLQTFFPDAYTRVRQNRAFLTNDLDVEAMILHHVDSDDARRRRRDAFNQIITGTRGLDDDEKFEQFCRGQSSTASDYMLVRDVVAALFPYAAGDLNATAEQTRIDRRLNRIVSPDRFERYFSLQLPTDEVSDEVIDHIVSAIASSRGDESTDQVKRLFDPLLREGRLSRSAVLKLDDRLVDTEFTAALQLGSAFLAVRDWITADELLGLLNASLVAASRSTETEDRQRIAGLAERAVKEIGDPLLALLAANTYSRQHRELDITIERRQLIAELGLRRMRAFVEGGGDVFAATDLQSASHVLWRWRDLLVAADRGLGDFQGYIRTLLQANPAYLPNILAMAAGWGTEPSLEGVQSREEVRRSLDTVYGTEELLDLAKRFQEQFGEDSDPFKLVPQFLRIFGSSDAD